MRTTKSSRLQIVVNYGSDEPRIFDAVVCAPAADIRDAITTAAQAFNVALHQSLERSCGAHTTKVIATPDRAA